MTHIETAIYWEQRALTAEGRIGRADRALAETQARVAELEAALRGAEWCLHRASTIYVRDRDLAGYRERWQAIQDALKGNHAD